MRIALPQAESGVFLALPLGVSFPFNITIGLPLYLWVARLRRAAPLPFPRVMAPAAFIIAIWAVSRLQYRRNTDVIPMCCQDGAPCKTRPLT